VSHWTEDETANWEKRQKDNSGGKDVPKRTDWTEEETKNWEKRQKDNSGGKGVEQSSSSTGGKRTDAQVEAQMDKWDKQ
jgi:hypothetical protein